MSKVSTKLIDMVGFEVNGITVLEFSHYDTDKRRLYSCICACGELVVFSGKRLRKATAYSVLTENPELKGRWPRLLLRLKGVTDMSKIIGYLAVREGRKLFSEDFPMWCSDDINYTVIELVANDGMQEAQLIEARDARDLLSEMYALQDEEIGCLKARIKELEK